ncbi:EamA family transporter [Corynebacterium sp. LK2510]|uniref:EamA family transporter n=1 Tax=Corynebacterium sp. LK2510 TaxID=3110472 RepID=UPI0034CF49D6
MTQESARTAIVVVALNYLVWGILPLFWALLDDVNALYVLAQRILWATVIAGAWVFLSATRRGGVRGGGLKAAFAGTSPALVASAMAISVNWGLYIWAVSNGFVAYTALAYFVCPLLSVLLGAVVFAERLSPAQLIAILLASFGAVVFGWGQAGMGLIIVFGVAGSFAIYAAIKRTVKVQTVTGLFVESAILSPAAFLVISTGMITPDVHVTPKTWVLFVLAGFVTFLPLVVMSHYARIVPFTLLGVLQYIAPITQLVLGVTVFGEAISGRQIAALAVIIVGVGIFVASTNGRRRARHT